MDALIGTLRHALTPDELRENPFRLSCVRVDAPTKDVSRALARLKVAVELGTVPEHSFAPHPMCADTVTKAELRAKDPVRRLLDECLWFWPLDLNAPDAALEQLANGQIAAAESTWREYTRHQTWGPFARHNLAIASLLRASDLLLETRSRKGDKSNSVELSQAWTTALSEWGMLFDQLPIEDRVRARARAINDPRIQSTLAGKMASKIPTIVGLAGAEAALEMADSGLPGAKDVAALAEKLAAAGADGAILSMFQNEVRHLQQLCETNASKSDPRDSWEPLIRAAEQSQLRLSLFECCRQLSDDIGNTCANALRDMAIKSANTHNAYEVSVRILDVAQKMATGPLLEKLKGDIKTARALAEDARVQVPIEGIMSEITSLRASESNGELTSYLVNNSSLGKLMVRIRGIHERIIILELEGKAPEESIKRAMHELIWTIRSLSVETQNRHNDTGAAIVILTYALNLVRPSEDDAKLIADMDTLRRIWKNKTDNKNSTGSTTWRAYTRPPKAERNLTKDQRVKMHSVFTEPYKVIPTGPILVCVAIGLIIGGLIGGPPAAVLSGLAGAVIAFIANLTL